MRKPLYDTPEELQAAVDAYFRHCAGVPVFDSDGFPVKDAHGREVRKGAIPPTVTGLSLFLGFASRKGLHRQGERGPEWRFVVQRARARCELYTEERLYYCDTYKGAAYMLIRAFGWRRFNDEETPVIITTEEKEDL